MSKYKQCMLVDGIVIGLGIAGAAYVLVKLLLALQGHILIDLNELLILPVAVFFVYYGFRQMAKDKKKYKDGNKE